MAKFCGKCGAQLSDEMIFCNKCGARYREAQASNPQPTPAAYTATPTPPAQNYTGAYNSAVPTARPATPTNPMWFVAIILSLASILLFAFAPTIKAAVDVTATYQGQTQSMSEDAGEASSIFDVCDVEAISDEQLNYYGLDSNTYNDAVDKFETAKILAIVAIVAGAIGVILLIAPLVNKNMNTNIAFGAVVTQVILLGAAAIISFVLIKDATQSLTEVVYANQLSAYGASGSVDVNVTFDVLGWIFLCAGALAILATIKAVQSSKSANTNFNAPRPY